MADFFNQTLVQWILAAIVAVGVLALFGWLKLKRDEKLVAEFLRASGVDSHRRFRTTAEISKATDLHEDRIRVVCKKSTRIRPKREEGDAWKLHD